MSLRSLLLSGLITLTACGGGTAADADRTPRLQKLADGALASGLAGVVLAHVTLDDTARVQAGVRQAGATAKVQPGDVFLIGSTTKAMTAALAGRIVQQGSIAWTTTLAEALPDLAAGMHPAYRGVTLSQLLDHRGGLPGFDNGEDVDRFNAFLQSYEGDLPTTLSGRERFFAAWLLSQDPAAGVAPGQTYGYSNAGYTMAALMLQARTGRAFVELFEQELARPLGLALTWTSADKTFTDRPVGHAGSQGKLVPLPPEETRTAEWLDVLRAGGEGLTINAQHYATWVRWHLRALRGEATPLANGYLQRLKALRSGDYALGWVATDIDGRAVLTHDGAYLGFSSLITVDLQGRSASFAFTNTQADDGVWALTVLTQAILDTERALPPK